VGAHGSRAAAQEPRLIERTRRSDLYGRRLGRPLSAHQQTLVNTLLPRIGLPSGPLDLAVLFPGAREFALEIGFGGGEHLAAQAHAHPEMGFIGCEPFLNGVAKLLTSVEEGSLPNVRVHADDARGVLARLDDRSLSRVFLLFPDPWPKLRHHKRRFIQPETLDALARVMRSGAELRIATDHGEYAAWALMHLMRDDRFRWTAALSQDWSARGVDWPATRYEQKALQAGRSCCYLRFLRV
jgi:tRNA (guanine-N7-)-methyltransferase